MKKRFVLGNLIYYLDENKVFLMNLVNFRRQKVDKEFISTIIEIEHKINIGLALSEEENRIINDLYEKRQVLKKDELLEIEQILKDKDKLSMEKFPVKSIMLNLTYECNFRCLYCYQNKYKDRPEYKQFMTTDDIDLIKKYLLQDYLDTTEMDEVSLSGGESLFPQNIDTINYVLKNFNPKEFIIFTNGVNLYEYRNYIDYNLVNKFQISLDGTAEIIKYINQNTDPSVFNKIIDGIKHIESLNKKITVVVMLTKELVQNIDEFIDILKKNNIIGKSNMDIRFSLVTDNFSKNTIDYAFYDLDYLCSIVRKLNLKLAKIGSFVEVYREGISLNHLIHRTVNKKSYIKDRTCDFTKAVPMNFVPNGDIFWCLCLGHENGRIGNYKENIYFDKEKVLKLGNRTIFKIEKCKTCDLKYICAGGCPLPLISCDSDFNEPVCGLYGLDEFWDRLEELV